MLAKKNIMILTFKIPKTLVSGQLSSLWNVHLSTTLKHFFFYHFFTKFLIFIFQIITAVFIVLFWFSHKNKSQNKFSVARVGNKLMTHYDNKYDKYATILRFFVKTFWCGRSWEVLSMSAEQEVLIAESLVSKASWNNK